MFGAVRSLIARTANSVLCVSVCGLATVREVVVKIIGFKACAYYEMRAGLLEESEMVYEKCVKK